MRTLAEAAMAAIGGVVAFVIIVACGGSGKSWPADQAVRTTNSVKSWVLLESLCAGPDTSQCTPDNVAALAHGSICPEASGLYQHGDPLPPLGSEKCPVPAQAP